LGLVRIDVTKKAVKRAAPEGVTLKPKYMETTIVCDKSMVEYHKGHRDLDVYMLTVANTVSCLLLSWGVN